MVPSGSGNLDFGDLERSLEGHTGPVRAVAVSPDGHRIVSGSNDHTIRIWNLDSGCLERILEGHTDEIWAVAVSPDGHRVVRGVTIAPFVSGTSTLAIWS